MPVTKGYNLTKSLVALAYLLRFFAECFFTEEHFNISILKKHTSLVNTDIRCKGNNNITAADHTRKAGNIFVICITDKRNVHFFFPDCLDVSADSVAILSEFSKASDTHLVTAEKATEILVAIHFGGKLYQRSDCWKFVTHNTFLRFLYSLLLRIIPI